MEPQKHDQKEMRKHFLQSLYDTLDGVVSPTPYMEITEGESVDVKLLNGKGRLPDPNSTEITVLDIDIASMFFDDFHVLYEGVTGIGKTFTSDALFNAVFGQEGYYTLRLSGGIFGASPLDPYTEFDPSQNKTYLDSESLSKYGALFIDEINRGDSQEVFQVVDGEINVGGETGKLQIPIPGTDRYKKLAIISAMNPADGDHNDAGDLDIAGENRFLKFTYPNGVTEAGSSQLEKKVSGDLHSRFWDEFTKRSGIEGGWRDIYPLVTDSEQFEKSLSPEAKEFIDTALGFVGEDPKEAYNRNLELVQQAEILPEFTLREDNDYQTTLEAQGKLKHGFVRRDIRKISDLSKLLGFIKGIKNQTFDTNVYVNDVAAAMGITLESKTVTGEGYGELMPLVNTARSYYNNMRDYMGVPSGNGITQTVWQAAIYAGQEGGTEAYFNQLESGIDKLNTPTDNNAEAVMKSRVLADLCVLKHFSETNKEGLVKSLKKGGEESFKSFAELYEENKHRSSVYEHRIGPIVKYYEGGGSQ